MQASSRVSPVVSVCGRPIHRRVHRPPMGGGARCAERREILHLRGEADDLEHGSLGSAVHDPELDRTTTARAAALGNSPRKRPTGTCLRIDVA